MLCELPVSLDNDLKELKDRDVLNMSPKEFEDKKTFLMQNGQKTLRDLESCKEKLLAFHSEPLIAPIFKDVLQKLKKVQTYLFLLFNESFAKLPLEVLSQLYLKLEKINNFLQECQSRVSHKDLNINLTSTESLTLTFFKYFYMNWEKNLRIIEKNCESLNKQKKIFESPVINLKFATYEDFTKEMKKVLSVNRSKESWRIYKNFMDKTFDIILLLDNHFIKRDGNLIF